MKYLSSGNVFLISICNMPSHACNDSKNTKETITEMDMQNRNIDNTLGLYEQDSNPAGVHILRSF